MRWLIPVLFLTAPLQAQSLEGLWQFSSDGRAWQSVRVPSNLHGLVAPNERLILRRTLSVDTDVTGWRTGIVSDAARFFANGVALNDPSSPPTSYDRNHILRIEPHGKRLELRIEFQPYFSHEYGLLRGDPAVGNIEELRDNYTIEQLHILLLPFVFTLLSFYYAAAFLLFRSERSAIPLALFLMILSIYLLQRSDLKYSLHVDLLQLKRIEYVSLMLLLPTLLLFFHFLFRRRCDLRLRFRRAIRRITSFMAIICLAALVAAAFWILFEDDIRLWDRFNSQIVQPVIWPLLFLVMAVRLIENWRIGRPLIIGILIALTGTLLDIANHQEWINTPPAAPVSLLAFVGGLALSQVEKSVQTRRELSQLNADLERRVDHRTREYKRSLAEIRTLKEQQDGDYYLTSLVLRPLSCRNMTGGNSRMTWSSFTKQKKSFAFRHNRSELGGDINIVETVRLRGREYVAFLNADAMGKSIQGAGGAVVIGTVLGASLSRTKRLPELSALYPEEWLRRCYEDLQNVFYSFNGSMMASAVLGLIDTTAGCLYHWNAEHPPLVLVRAGTADYIHPSGMLYRLGAPLPEQELRVHVCSLRPGDVLYAGTDGRDDLSIDGRIESDSGRFLEIVTEHENSKAELSALVERLETFGALSDDLALLRFAFTGKQRSLPGVLRRQAATLLRERRWKESLPTLESYIELNPSDERSLRVGVRIARRLGHPLAERWHRRLRLRDSTS